jgi:hypothetical protein
VNDPLGPPDFIEHALLQMQERGISTEEVLAVVSTAEPFPYNQHGRPRLGFYDEVSLLFVAVAEGRVVTVFRARASYVAGLRRRS